MNVPHLIVYFDPKLEYVVDDDLPDNEDGTRNHGTNGVQFTSPKSAGEYVAFRLTQWQAENDAREAEEEKQARSAIFRAKLEAYGGGG